MTPVDSEVISLLKQLVAIESVNPRLDPTGSGESAIAAFVSTWSADNGLTAEIVDGEAGRPNVLVRSRLPEPGTQTLLLCAHLDTVGVGSMIDPLLPRIDGDRLYGRGTYDMKAGLAAALIACREAALAGLSTRVVVAAVADEEHGSLGIQRVLDHFPADAADAAAAAIVTEPTEMTIGVAHKGFVWTEINIEGRAAHGSRPELGTDAIVKAGPLLVGLEELGRRVGSHRHPLLGTATIHASLIEGGQGPSTIPGHCRLTIERRTLPGESLADTEQEISDLLARCADADRDFVATASTLMYRPPLETRSDHPIVQAVSAAHQSVRGQVADVTGMSYWADSAFIAARGIPTVLFGPGGDGAHAEVEWVSIADTVDCARILFDVASSMDHKPLE